MSNTNKADVIRKKWHPAGWMPAGFREMWEYAVDLERLLNAAECRIEDLQGAEESGEPRQGGESSMFDLVAQLKAIMDRDGWKTLHAHGLAIGPTDAHGPLVSDLPAPRTQASPPAEGTEAEQNPIVPIGTKTKWGEVCMVSIHNGERMYSMVDAHGNVASMPAKLVEWLYGAPEADGRGA